MCSPPAYTRGRINNWDDFSTFLLLILSDMYKVNKKRSFPRNKKKYMTRGTKKIIIIIKMIG